MKILFVCTGNTCRSPMAEGIFRKMIEDHGDEDRLYCMSAGLAASDGQPAADNAVQVCREMGVEISKHRARSLQSLQNLEAFDVFAVMTVTQGYVLRQAGIPKDRIYVLEGEIPDPFGGDEKVYRACRDRIATALQILYPLAKQHASKEPCDGQG